MYRVGGVEMSGKGRDSIETLLKSNKILHWNPLEILWKPYRNPEIS